MTDQTTPTRPRHRWFRYSLRTLLVFTAVVGLLMGWVVMERMQSAREWEIAEQLRQQGWIVRLGGPFDSSDLFFRSQRQGWWRRMARQILGERIVILYNMNSSNEVDLVAKLAGLKVLRLDIPPISHRTPIGDLTPIGELTMIERLGFTGTPDIDLAPLTKLKRLKALYIAQTQIPQERIDALQRALPTCKIEHSP